MQEAVRYTRLGVEINASKRCSTSLSVSPWECCEARAWRSLLNAMKGMLNLNLKVALRWRSKWEQHERMFLTGHRVTGTHISSLVSTSMKQQNRIIGFPILGGSHVRPMQTRFIINHHYLGIWNTMLLKSEAAFWCQGQLMCFSPLVSNTVSLKTLFLSVTTCAKRQ